MIQNQNFYKIIMVFNMGIYNESCQANLISVHISQT